jgi:hypothetical protein
MYKYCILSQRIEEWVLVQENESQVHVSIIFNKNIKIKVFSPWGGKPFRSYYSE